MTHVGTAYRPQAPVLRLWSKDAVDHPASQLLWFVGGAGLAFLVPYLFSSRLKLQHDWYYLIYFTATGCFLGLYVVKNAVDLRDIVRRGWRPSAALGVFAAVFVTFNVLQREPATPHPAGAYFAFELLWRGVAYGAVDALLLTAFPGLAAFLLMHRNIAGIKRRIGFAALALTMTLVITATYHLGYSQFREAGVVNPEIGNTIISVPMLATGNPIGAVIAHTTMHVVANVHAYETNVFLPPQTNVTP